MRRALQAFLAIAVLLIGAPAIASVHGGGGSFVGDAAFKTYGAYGIYNAAFRAGAMGYSRGPDYWDATHYTPGNLQSGVTITSQWPSNPNGCMGSICGFNALDYGHYDDTVVASPITARQISGITTLQLALTETFGGTAAGYDHIVDVFTTMAANDNSNNLHELEIMLHCAPGFCQTFANATTVGTFTDSFGNAWILKHSGTINIAYLASFPDWTSGSIDILQIFQHFVSAGLMANTEWFNGCAIGIEPFRDDASVTLTSVAFTYN